MTKPVKIAFLFAGIVVSCAIVGLGLETIPQNALGWPLVFVGLAYCMGGSIYLAVAQTRGAIAVEPGDRSLWLIAPGFMVVFAAPPLEYLYLPPLLPRAGTMQLAGLGLMGLGLGLRFWTRWSLGRMYTGHLQVQAGHRLVQAGPYRLIRHPGYTGLGLVALGLCVGYSSLIGLAALLLMLPGVAYRMQAEEQLLTGQFGEEYRLYQQRTKRLIPGIW